MRVHGASEARSDRDWRPIGDVPPIRRLKWTANALPVGEARQVACLCTNSRSAARAFRAGNQSGLTLINLTGKLTSRASDAENQLFPEPTGPCNYFDPSAWARIVAVFQNTPSQNTNNGGLLFASCSSNSRARAAKTVCRDGAVNQIN